MSGSENKAHEKGELSVTLGDPTAKAQLLSQLHCSRKDSLPQTPFCSEVKMISMGTQQFSLNTHISNGGMWLFSKACQMEKGGRRVAMNICPISA